MFRGRFKKKVQPEKEDRRLLIIRIGCGLFGILIIGRLFQLQVLDHDYYVKAAETRHGLYQTLLPSRGQIYFQDLKSPDRRPPLALNNDIFTIYADPKLVKDAPKMAEALAKKLNLDKKEVLAKVTIPGSRYEIIAKKISQDIVDQLKLEKLAGIDFEREPFRFYPERDLASQEVGYFGYDQNAKPKGFYGVEGYFDDLLSGKTGFLEAEHDARGGWLPLAPRKEVLAQDGADLVLTLDRTIEYVACEELKKGIEEYQAKSGSIIIMNPKTGAVLAMCNEPGFDPNHYGDVTDMTLFNNQAIFSPYEPGSVFKIITMAGALDAGKITPDTTYVDTGEVKFGKYTIRNAANKKYGEQTMTGVLKESINTGAIFAAQKLGLDLFKKYAQDFGFGVLSGIEMDREAGGSIDSLDQKGDIYLATASFGQGITTTPIQLVSAASAIANQGKLFKPYIVSEIDYPDGNKEIKKPEFIRQVISERAARLLAGMMTVVVKEGHGKAAQVPGYYIAGKTGTAQIAGPGGKYIEGATNQTFVGFGPVDDPRFVMLVKYENPARTYAESTAVPTFGKVAKFLLQYLEVPPSR